MNFCKIFVLIAVIFVVGCRPKENPEEFPATFENINYSIASALEIDTLDIIDSTYTAFQIRSNRLGSYNEQFFKNNALEAENQVSWNFTETKILSEIVYSGTRNDRIEITTNANETQVAHKYTYDENFLWDDSTITYMGIDPETRKPSNATIKHYLLHGGSEKTAYRIQQNLNFTYSGNNLRTIDVVHVGAVDSIFVPNLTPEQTNYDTNTVIIHSADTVPFLVRQYRYTPSLPNTIEKFFPSYFFGLEHFMLSATALPKNIEVVDFFGGTPLPSYYRMFEYINDPVSGQLIAVQEHFSTTTITPSINNRVRSYFITEDFVTTAE